jgi:hypothetical protein
MKHLKMLLLRQNLKSIPIGQLAIAYFLKRAPPSFSSILFDEKNQKFSFSQQFSSPFLFFIAMRASGFSSSPFPRYEP